MARPGQFVFQNHRWAVRNRRGRHVERTALASQAQRHIFPPGCRTTGGYNKGVFVVWPPSKDSRGDTQAERFRSVWAASILAETLQTASQSQTMFY